MIRYFTLIVGVVTGMLCSFLSTAQENEEASLFQEALEKLNTEAYYNANAKQTRNGARREGEQLLYQDFEGAYSGWQFSGKAYGFAVGAQDDHDNASYAFPQRQGKWVAVNTANISVGTGGYASQEDLVVMPVVNFEQVGKAFFAFDYVSQMAGFGIFGKSGPDAEWQLLKIVDQSDSWTHLEFEIPQELLTATAQLGLYYTNGKKASKGVAFDNVAIRKLTGKHQNLFFNGKELTDQSVQYLGMTKPGTELTKMFLLINVGDEALQINSVNLEGDKFSLVDGDYTGTLAVKDTLKIQVRYSPDAENSAADVAKLSLETDAEESPVEVTLQAKCGIANWTYMLYLYEDGTGLDGNEDINEWEMQGSVQGKINYLVLYDSDDDRKDGIYYVVKDENGMNEEIVSEKVSTFLNKDLDMNDSETLREFILWAKENYPAEHYGCNVWDHGSGIFKSGQRQQWKAACGEMRLWELAEALKAFKEVDDKGFDIFGFDVCLMGQVETVYEIRNYTDIVIASEKTEPGDGWDYNTQFSLLNQNPEVDIYNFAEHIVVEYDASYHFGSQGYQATTQAAVRTDVFKSQFIPEFNTFASMLAADMVDIKEVVKAVREDTWYSDGNDYADHKDLGHFLSLLKKRGELSAELKEQIEALRIAYNNAIVMSLENQRPEATGMKIWMPEDISAQPLAPAYLYPNKYLDFSQTNWDEYLYLYETPMESAIPEPKLGYKGSLTILANDVVHLVDLTIANPMPTGRKWKITPETYEFVETTTDVDKEIAVKFLEVGSYTISLEVTNDLGAGSMVKNNMVTVRSPEFVAPIELQGKWDSHSNAVSLTWKDGSEDLPEGTKLQEGFEGNEFPSAGWSLGYSDGIHKEISKPTESDGRKWFQCDQNSFGDEGQPEPKYIHQGNYSAAIGYSAPDFNWLISPEVEVENTDQLSFWMWYMNGEAQGGTYYTNLYVLVFADNAWHQERRFTKGDETNEYQKEVIVDLSAYAGKMIKVAFVYEYTDGFQCALDDITIKATTAKSAPVINLNPAKGRMNFTKKIDMPLMSFEKGDGQLVEYAVFRDDKEIAVTKNKSFKETIAETEQSYVYHVIARYTNPTGESKPSNQVTIKVGGATAIEDVVSVDKVCIYPNPSQGRLVLSNPAKGQMHWQLFNAIGALVKENTVYGHEKEIFVERAGVYFLRVEVDKHVRTFKLIVN